MLSYALSHVQTVACFDDETRNLPRPNALNATQWHHLCIFFLITLFCLAVSAMYFSSYLKNSTEV